MGGTPGGCGQAGADVAASCLGFLRHPLIDLVEDTPDPTIAQWERFFADTFSNGEGKRDSERVLQAGVMALVAAL